MRYLQINLVNFLSYYYFIIYIMLNKSLYNQLLLNVFP